MFGKKTFKKGMEFKNSHQISRRLFKNFLILVSKSEVESLEKHFMSIDKNSDRLINKKEFSTALGMMPNDTYLSNAIFEAIDTNKNGEISFEEYMDTMAVLLHGTPDERLVSNIF
jgi:Ca2+-binding EF-hand superfamily protein